MVAPVEVVAVLGSVVATGELVVTVTISPGEPAAFVAEDSDCTWLDKAGDELPDAVVPVVVDGIVVELLLFCVCVDVLLMVLLEVVLELKPPDPA